MSKEAALRAMREAKYNARTAAATGATKPARPARAAKARPTPGTEQAEPVDALCGHKSMNGRTCTREHGHAAKSHRYS